MSFRKLACWWRGVRSQKGPLPRRPSAQVMLKEDTLLKFKTERNSFNQLGR